MKKMIEELISSIGKFLERLGCNTMDLMGYKNATFIRYVKLKKEISKKILVFH